jgi:hypothetical protein
MSAEVDLADVKKALRVTHAEDDDLLSRLIESATRECLAFLNRDDLPTMDIGTEDEPGSPQTFITQDIFQGIVHLVQADYEGKIEDRPKYRAAAEVIWFPYRRNFGV